MLADQIVAERTMSHVVIDSAEGPALERFHDGGTVVVRRHQARWLKLEAFGRWILRAAASTHAYPFPPAHEFSGPEKSVP